MNNNNIRKQKKKKKTTKAVPAGFLSKLEHAHLEEVTSLVALSDGQTLVSGSLDTVVSQWGWIGVHCKRHVGDYKEHQDRVYGLVEMEEQRSGSMVASCSWDRTIKLWNSRELATKTTVKTESQLNAIARVSPSTVAVGGRYGTLQLWDLEAGRCVLDLGLNAETSESEERGSYINSLTHFKNAGQGMLISTDDQGLVKAWDTKSSRLIHTLKGHCDIVRDAIEIENGGALSIASCSLDKTIKLWDLRKTEDCAMTLEGHQAPVESIVCFGTNSHGTTSIVSGSIDCSIKTWNINSGVCIDTFKTSDEVTKLVKLKESGKIAVGLWHGDIEFWDVI